MAMTADNWTAALLTNDSRVRAGTPQAAISDSSSILLHPAPSSSMKDVLFTSTCAPIDSHYSEIFSQNNIQRFCIHLCVLSNIKICQTAKHKTLQNTKKYIWPIIACWVSSHEDGPSLFPIWKALQVRQSSYHGVADYEVLLHKYIFVCLLPKPVWETESAA